MVKEELYLIDLSRIKLFNITEKLNISTSNKIDRNTLPSKPSRTTDPVDIVLSIHRKIIIDHQRNLLYLQRQFKVHTQRPEGLSGGEGTSIPLAQMSVVSKTRDVPCRKSDMIESRSF